MESTITVSETWDIVVATKQKQYSNPTVILNPILIN